jgi:hypothetical protein
LDAGTAAPRLIPELAFAVIDALVIIGQNLAFNTSIIGTELRVGGGKLNVTSLALGIISIVINISGLGVVDVGGIHLAPVNVGEVKVGEQLLQLFFGQLNIAISIGAGRKKNEIRTARRDGFDRGCIPFIRWIGG